jgi:hypothetical protein
VRPGRLPAPAGGLQAHPQLLWVHRLGDDVVGPDLQQGAQVMQPGRLGDEEDLEGRVLRQPADAPADLVAVQPGRRIEQDDLDLLLGQRLPRALLAVRRQQANVTAFPQAVLQDFQMLL